MSRKRRIRPIDLQDYLFSQGWVLESNEVRNGMQLMVHSDHPGTGVSIPVDPTYSGGDAIVDLSLKHYSELCGIPEDVLRGRVADIDNDVMQVRVFSARAAEGIPLNFAVAVTAALRKLLRAGYHAATRHRGMRAVGNTDEVLARKLIATIEVEHHNGFTDFRMACPLRVSRAEIETREPDTSAPLARRVMRAIASRLADLHGTIADDNTKQFLDMMRADGWYNTSATFAEALLELFDTQFENALEIRFFASPHFPIESLPSDRPAHFRSFDVSFVERVYELLLLSEERQTYLGVVAHVQPDNVDGSPGTGKAILTLLDSDGDTVPVQFDLTAQHYTKVVGAYKVGRRHLRVTGLLRAQRGVGTLARYALTEVSVLDFLVDDASAGESGETATDD